MFVLGPKALSWSEVRFRKWNWTIRERERESSQRLAEME